MQRTFDLVRARRRAAVAAALLTLLVLVGPQPPSAAQEDPTSTTVGSSTSNLLVPGDGTNGAQVTTTTETAPSPAGDDGLSDATLISLVIGGLLLVAVLVGVLTWRYWLATRPVVPDEARR